jgi:hypothetical protein
MGFEDDLRAFEKKATSRMRTFRRALAMKVFSRVILRTPVDTGRARANWQTTVGAPASGTISADPDTGSNVKAPNPSSGSAMSIGTINAAVASVDDDQSIFLTNNLPYIEALENGHSQQSPAGMVAMTLAEFEGQAEQIRNQILGGSNADTES